MAKEEIKISVDEAKKFINEMMDKWGNSSDPKIKNKLAALYSFAQRWKVEPETEESKKKEQLNSAIKKLDATIKSFEEMGDDVSFLIDKRKEEENKLEELISKYGAVKGSSAKGASPLYKMRSLYNKIKRDQTAKDDMLKMNAMADVSSLEAMIEKNKKDLEELEKVHGEYDPNKKTGVTYTIA